MPFTLTMPKMSPTMTEGTIAKWHKKEGEHVNADELLLEVATDKATVEYNAIDEGFLRKILIKEGGEAVVNEPIAIFTVKKEESIEGYKPEGEMSAAQAKEAAKSSPTEAPKGNDTFGDKRVLASPLAKRLAKEKGLDLALVQGSGPRGRVMSRDLATASLSGSQEMAGRRTPSLPSGTFEEEKMTPMRKAIAQRLQQSKTFTPHFYVTTEIDADALTAAREQLKQGDVKVTFNDFVVRAVALALKQHPVVNSGYNSESNTLIRFKTVDISIAVNLENGLITPIVRQADYKSIAEISGEIKSLASKAREGRLQEQEYKGGSFTISNLGMFGVTHFQAIINPPQAANLAVGAILDVPVVKEGKVVPGKKMNLTLSADHRVVDGAAGASFLQTMKKLLENPALLLF